MCVIRIKLGDKEVYVIALLFGKREGTIMVATQKGLGKSTNVIKYRSQT